MVSPLLSKVPIQQFFMGNGVPLSGGKLFTYAAGTTTKQPTYTDASGSTQNTNPIIINSNGYPQNGSGQTTGIWLDPSLNYKFVLAPATDTDPPANPIWSIDNIPGSDASQMYVNDGASGSLFTTLQGFINKLLSSAGASIVGFLQAGTGAVFRSSQDKMRDWVSAKDFGAKGDNVNDDTSAIQLALNTGKSVYLPSGTYKISALLTATTASQTFFGAGAGQTSIVQTTLNTGIFSDNGQNQTVLRDMRLTYSSPASAGGNALVMKGFYSSACNFVIYQAYNGIYLAGTSGSIINSVGFVNFQVENSVNCGMYLYWAYNINVENFYIVGSDNVTQGLSGQLYMFNGQGNNFSMGEIFNGVKGAVMDTCQYCRFEQIYFDSSAQGSSIVGSTALSFIGCWWSAGRTGGGFPGLTIGNSGGTDTTVGIDIVGSQFINCGSDGCLVYAGPTKIRFNSCQFGANSLTSGANTKHGLEFAVNASNFSVIGCTFTNSLGFSGGTQAYGLFINGGTSSQYVISGNDFNGNGTGPMLDAGTSSSRYVFGNSGYINSFRGTCVVANGTSSVVVNHGLSVTPAASDIIALPTSNPGAAGVTSWWISAVTATTFTLTTNASATAGLIFTWDAKTKGAV